MKIKCLAIDDEPVALSIIAEYCRRYGDIELAVHTDPVEGMKHLKEEVFDVVFLDIEMNGISGISLARELPEGTCLVFTTAYARFALDGFELNAIDFLHKPFLYSRFCTAVEKVAERIRLRELERNIERKDVITLRSEYRHVNIPVSSVRYIEAMDNYVKIIVDGREPVFAQTSMKDMISLLPEGRFARIHRSYIVPLDRIMSYSRKEVKLSPEGTVLPVGRVYSDEFVRIASDHLRPE